MANEVGIWNKVMSAAMAIPGVKVDRELFLRGELRPYCTKEQMESKRLGITVFQSRLKVRTFARTNSYEYGKQRQVQESA